MSKIRYDKEKKGRILGGTGPRDLQRRHRIIQQEKMVKEMVEAESGLHPKISKKDSDNKGNNNIDMSQYIPINEVKKKIEDAISFVREEERNRFESGLKSLNNQLNDFKLKVNNLEKELSTKDSDIEILESKLLDKDYVIDNLKSMLENRKNVYDQSQIDIGNLEERLDKIYNKISDGSIKPLVGSNMNRPALEDKIFIDPLTSEDNSILDSHIDIREEVSEDTSSSRNMEFDMDKLRSLLRK